MHTVLGLVLIALLVPILQLFRGAGGTLGPSIPLVFLIPVLLTSTLGGRIAGVIVAVVAVSVWDWYFITPLYTVTVGSARDLLALLVFLAVALLTGHLATTARRQTEEAVLRARSAEALYDLSMGLIARTDVVDVLSALTERLRTTFDLQASAVLLPDDTGLTWQTAASAGTLPREARVEESRVVRGMAAWVNEHGRPSGQREERTHLLPLRVGSRAVGVLQLVYKHGSHLDAEREHLLETFANGAALALEQARLSREERAAAMAQESDRLKTALLSSVSHDLRTPLAGIKAAASSLLQDDVRWSEEDHHTFVSDINSEADRLTRLVSNLLDLSRIEAGAIQPDREWEDMPELIERVVRRLDRRMTGHHVVIDAEAGLPHVWLDAVQIEQVLINLLENAAKYSPAGSTITIAARVVEDSPVPNMRVSVTDQGSGILPADQRKIFDTFYRLTSSTHRTPGTGMGLAIVKGLAEANGGTVAVDSTPGQGSTFSLCLPLLQPGAQADLPHYEELKR
ncbi:MAG: hypothetical protein NVSMB22_19430 [Chloroflexota bacterium]